ncbi:bifunctional folylpolyglutamate synthase/dihydrofolate synthase [Robertkochia sediminum]|uniref:bifunctional folylpolyglutamate synthase/dihydrofolate synthase n=1 Tax=Robertkochia sediminum TaxID=2785326 RepID=UPI00293D2332|nr:folylpolyglutamate synthase/dihydrofolate synthase family protein [Robertkochia sediminum]
MMTYQETVNWMYVQLPMYQREGRSAFKPKLVNITALAAHLGNPQNTFKSIHVAGTNGKGSTSHMIASVLQEAGYKVGLYTSPHLKDFRERIRINGETISEADVVRFVDRNLAFFKEHQCSFFEMTVGMAFDHFSREEVDYAVIEVGLGGRLDSTNIITPVVSVITNIGMDHMDMLGDTLEAIAGEKAGIIKKGVPAVISEYQRQTWPVFKEKAAKEQAPLILADELSEDFKTDLKGKYQVKNIRAVVAAVRSLLLPEVSEEVIKSGLLKTVENTGLLGRWQQLGTDPLIICDTAHNREGLELVMSQLQEEDYDHLHIVIGVVKDKDLDRVLPVFPVNNVTYYFARPDIPRGMDAADLRAKASKYGLQGVVFDSVSEAFREAQNKAASGDLIFVGGSNFTVAEVL